MFERIASRQPRSFASSSAAWASSKTGHDGERMRERARLALRERQSLLVREPLERDRKHLAVRVARIRGLDLGLELVVAREQPVAALDAEQILELARMPAFQSTIVP